MFFFQSLRSLSKSLHFNRILLSSSSSISSISSSNPPISPSTTRIGWIGTGVMGRTLAPHLLSAGYPLTVFDQTPAKAQNLIDQGARLADSILTVARSSDVIFLFLNFASEVRRVVFRFLDCLSPNSFIVDMTTSVRSVAVDMHRVALKASCFYTDAPFSGGEQRAREATLSIYAGGDEAVVCHLTPLFECLGRVMYMGGPGEGQVAKGQIADALRVFKMVEMRLKRGVDFNQSLKDVMYFYWKRIVKREMKSGFYVHDFVEDLGISLKECERMGVAFPGLEVAQQMYASLMECGEGGLGTQALIQAVQRLNNTCLGKNLD